jgi:hypothetical protein
MTGVCAAVGFLWPFADASVLEALAIVFYVALILPVLPIGWLLIKRRYGTRAAGPLWPLLFFLVLASVYALGTPPWQTPDEPQHMVYAELVRRSGTSLPQRLLDGKPLTEEDAEVVRDVRRTVLASLRSVDLWPTDAQAVIDRGDIPGPTELTHPPLYYQVAASVTAPIGDAPILARLAILRAFGVMVAGWIVWLCGCAGRLVWPNRHRLAETPMVVAAAVPTFAAFAGTVNSDVLANLFGAAFLVVVLRLVVRHTRRDWIWWLVAVALLATDVMTKRSALPLVPVLAVALLLQRSWSVRRLLGGAIVLQLATAVFVLSLPTRPAVWAGPPGVRDLGCAGGRVGPTALCGVERGVSQPLLVTTLEEVAGKLVTVGFWARAGRAAKVTVYLGPTPTEQVTAGVDRWSFGRVVFRIPPDLRQVRISLVADGPARVDGVVLAEGRRSERAPRLGSGGSVRWDGRNVENLLSNGSAEDTVVGAPSWMPPNVARTFDGAVDAAHAVTSGEQASDAWSFIWKRLGVTFGIFWATTSWEQPPPLLPVAMRWTLAVIVGVALLGAALGGTRLGRLVWPGRAAAAMISAVLIGVLAVVVRGIPPTDLELVSGRYLFPGIVAIVTVIVAGWRWILSTGDRAFRATARWFAVATHLAFVVTIFAPFRWS